MPNPTQPSQAAREAAAEIVHVGAPGVGNGNKIISCEIKGGRHDEYWIVQTLVRFERDTEKRVRESLAGERDIGGQHGL